MSEFWQTWKDSLRSREEAAAAFLASLPIGRLLKGHHALASNNAGSGGHGLAFFSGDASAKRAPWDALLASKEDSNEEEHFGGSSAPPKYEPPLDDPRAHNVRLAGIVLENLIERARKATNAENLYREGVDAIRDGLCSTTACFFLRNDEGDYDWYLAAPERRTHAAPLELSLKKDSFSIRRIERLRDPLAIEPGDFDAWEHGLEKSFPDLLAKRREEIETLQIVRARLLVPVEQRGKFVGVLAIGPREDGTPHSLTEREMMRDLAAQFAYLMESFKYYHP